MNYTIIKPDAIFSSMMNDSSMIKQFVTLYLSQCPMDFQTLENAVSKMDKFAISDAAHHIKPTMEYIGAKDLRINFQELEDYGKNQAHDKIIQDKFDKVKTDFEIMLKELKSFSETI